MNNLRMITDEELVQLYSVEDHNSIASLLGISSSQGLQDLKGQIFRIARAYDAGLFEAAKKPYDHETRESLKNIRRLAQQLELAIAKSNDYARSDVAIVLSKARDVRKLSTGEEVLPYEHPLSNEWIFDKESLVAFGAALTCLDVHLEARVKRLGRGGRPRGPEQSAIKELEKVWRKRHGTPPFGEVLSSFTKLCELTLRPVAAQHGSVPDIAASVKNALYGIKPKPGPWEV
jgi:hypothetical protein